MLYRSALTAILLVSILSYTSCSKDDDSPPAQTEVEKVTQILIGNSEIGTDWSLTSVTVDAIDYTDVYTGFEIDFQDGQYTTANGGVVFNGNGSWSFTDETASAVVLNSDLTLSLTEVSDSQLIFSVQLDETIYGRQSAVGGVNIFTLNR